jgi:hypothetical protein
VLIANVRRSAEEQVLLQRKALIAELNQQKAELER